MSLKDDAHKLHKFELKHPGLLDRMVLMREEGLSIDAIAKRLYEQGTKLSSTSVWLWLKRSGAQRRGSGGAADDISARLIIDPDKTIEQCRDAILRAGSVAGAARELEVSNVTLYRWLRAHPRIMEGVRKANADIEVRASQAPRVGDKALQPLRDAEWVAASIANRPGIGGRELREVTGLSVRRMAAAMKELGSRVEHHDMAVGYFMRDERAELPPSGSSSIELSSDMEALVEVTNGHLEDIITVLERTDARFALVESRLASLEDQAEKGAHGDLQLRLDELKSRLFSLEKGQTTQSEFLLEQLADFSTKTGDLTKSDLTDATRPIGDAVDLLRLAINEQIADREVRKTEVDAHFRTLAARLEVQAERMLPLAALTHLDENIEKSMRSILKEVIKVTISELFEDAVEKLARRLSIADTMLKKNLEAIGNHNRLFSEVIERDRALSKTADVTDAARARETQRLRAETQGALRPDTDMRDRLSVLPEVDK